MFSVMSCQIPQTPSEEENGNLDSDVSSSQSVPSASVICSDVIGVRAEPFPSGPSHFRGGPSQRRQGQLKGPRRGGRGRPQHGRPGPPIEHLDRLSLSLDSTHDHSSEGPIKAKLKVNHSQQVLGNAELRRDSEGSQQEPLVSTLKQPVCQSSLDALNAECPRGAGESGSGRGHRGRRRGPHGSVQHPKHVRGTDHWDAPGAARHHWEGRGPRSRGGGPRRGYERGLHQKAAEREVGREGVL